MQLALAWLLHQGDDIVPIPGTKHRTYLQENIAAASLELSKSDLDFLARHFAPGVTSGERYSEAMLKLLDR